jgi:hypothetical protein
LKTTFRTSIERGSVIGSGWGTRWTACSPYGSGKANASSPVNDERSTRAPSAHTTDVPTLASNRVMTMPGDVQSGWLMYEYSPMVSTLSRASAPSRARMLVRPGATPQPGTMRQPATVAAACRSSCWSVSG